MAEYNICKKLTEHIYQASAQSSLYVIFCFNLNRRFQYRSAVRIWLVQQPIERTLKEKKQWIIALLILESIKHTQLYSTLVYISKFDLSYCIARARARTHTHTHTHTHTYMCICACVVKLYIYLITHKHMNTCVCVCVCLCKCVRVCAFSATHSRSGW